MNMIFKKSSIILVTALLQACSGSLDDVRNNLDGNASPIVNTTINTNVAVGVQTSLTATATDPDGDTLQYLWSITGLPTGSTTTLANANQPVSTFTPDLEGSYTTRLVVDDGINKVTRTATIQAVLDNIAPTASIANPPAVALNSLVQLDGTPSTDPNNDTLSYRWTFQSRPTGSQAMFNNANATQPSFTADVSGDYQVQLIVNDGELDSTPVTATVNASSGNGNASPIVNTMINTSIAVGVQTSLTATATDPDGDTLQYVWSITGAPTGSTATLATADQPVSTFTPDLEGSYTVQVMVSDDTNEVTRTATILATQAAAVGATVVGVTIESTSGTEQNTVPVTFGQVFKPGEIPENTLLSVRLADGTQELIPSQINKKATHADGSLRHAVVTARVPTLTPNNPQDIEIVVVDSVPTTQSVQLADLLATNFIGQVSLTVAGTAYTASITDLLTNTQPETWLSGPEVTEWIVSAPLKATNGMEHPHLTARFNVRAYASFDSVRVDVIIENNWAYEPNPQNFVYNVTVSLCGNDVYSKTGLTHYHHARWRKTFWCGTSPQRHIKHDLGYLLTTGAIPNYDASLVVPESDLQKMQDDWDTKVSNRSSLAINELMGTGFIYENMPGTGSRPDIAFFPRWVVRYLLSNDLRAKRVTLGSADAGAHWPIHYRDKTTGYPVSLADYPRMTLKGDRQSTYNQDTGLYEEFPECGPNGCDTPYSPDSAHQPALNYVPYLLTGDNYYLEELHFWSNYNMLQANPSYREGARGLVKWEQVRGQAWSLRTLAHAAYITPDNHLFKPYFVERLNNNIAWYNNYYINNLGDYSNIDYRNALGWIGNVRSVGGFPAKVISFWQNDFMTHVSGELVALGYTDITPFRNWISTFVAGRYLSEPNFCRYDAAEWNSIIQDPNTLQWIKNWARMQEVNHPERMNNCPTDGSSGANIKSTSGYIAQSRPALAIAVDSGHPQAQAAFDYLTQSQATAGANDVKYGAEPSFAVLPRN